MMFINTLLIVPDTILSTSGDPQLQPLTASSQIVTGLPLMKNYNQV